MGTNQNQRKKPGYNSTGDDVGRGLLALSSLGLSEYQPTGSNGQAVGNDAGRVLLAAASSGTSEVKTGGKYGDETLADSIFPSQVNGAFTGREGKRSEADAAAAAKAGAVPLAPDRTDAVLASTDRASLIRQRQNGRRSTFLSGPDGNMSTPPKTFTSGNY